MANGPISLENISDTSVVGIIYGGTGVGKTVLVGSSQKYRTLLIDIDDGAVSANAWAVKYGLRRDLCKVWTVQTIAEYNTAIAWWNIHKSEFDMIVVDTVTELQGMILREICERGKIQVPSQREWGIVLTSMNNITTQFRHSGKHVLFTAHETFREDTDTKRTMWQPAFQGAFKEQYGRHFSLIARYCMPERQVKLEDNSLQWQTERWLICHRDAVTHGKDRFVALEKYEPPYIDNIIDKMMAGIKRSTQTQGI